MSLSYMKLSYMKNTMTNGMYLIPLLSDSDLLLSLIQCCDGWGQREWSPHLLSILYE